MEKIDFKALNNFAQINILDQAKNQKKRTSWFSLIFSSKINEIHISLGHQIKPKVPQVLQEAQQLLPK